MMKIKVFLLSIFCLCFTISLESMRSRSPQRFSESQVLAAWKRRELIPNEEMVNIYEKECFASKDQDEKIPQHSVSDRIVRVVSANVHCCYGLRRIGREDMSGFEAMCYVFKKLNADILCLQELSNGVMPGTELTFVEYIQKNLQYPFVHFQQSWTYGSGPFGNAIFSRIPFKDIKGDLYQESQNIFKEKKVNLLQSCKDHDLKTTEGRTWIQADFEIDDKTVTVITTHLDTWDKTRTRRETEMKELALRISEMQKASKKNIMIVADFNVEHFAGYSKEIAEAVTFGVHRGQVRESLALPIYKHLEDIGLKDSYELERKTPPIQTFWVPSRVDLCMLDTRFELPHTTYIHSNVGMSNSGRLVVGSDHKSVVFDIDLKLQGDLT